MLSVLQISLLLLAASRALYKPQLSWRDHEPAPQRLKISNNLDPSDQWCHGKRQHSRILEDNTQMAAGVMGAIVQSVITATGVKEIAEVSRLGIINDT
ncbi:hypothetical protein SBOR_9621 [Sclerotinia borealis F-4128]|uniref:Uncharacterized protein n=1 Tax=Sclerotinia borealis (strain F-4128) TaxID=1432307 RepID=W9C270_SCLBF|nr:hypothetical protein SBOR_9621 [Sclerotinia borealis F-4128]